MKNKGVSPIIATVLLIFFVIVIAGTVIFWATDLLEKTKESANEEIDTLEAGDKIDYSVNDAVFVSSQKSNVLRVIEGLVTADQNTKKVKITMINNAELPLENFIIRVYDVNGNVYVNDDFKANLGPFEIKEVIFEFDDSNLDQIDYFEIIPKLGNKAIESKKIKFRAHN